MYLEELEKENLTDIYQVATVLYQRSVDKRGVCYYIPTIKKLLRLPGVKTLPILLRLLYVMAEFRMIIFKNMGTVDARIIFLPEFYALLCVPSPGARPEPI